MAKTYLQTKLSGTQGQVVGFNSSGNAEAQDFSGGFSPRILYIAASGMTVTATKGSIVVNATYESGQYIMKVPEFGTWIVSNGSKTTNVVVSEVTDYTAAFIDSVLNNNTWAVIKQVSDAGTAASTWNVGDCKQITLNGKLSEGLTLSNTPIWVFIIGFDHDINTELSGGHTITFNGFKTSSSDSNTYALVDSGYGSSKTTSGWFGMNISDDNTGSWKQSQMRTNIMPNFISAMPSDLQGVLKTVNKQSIAAYDQTTLETVQDKVFLLAATEMYGDSAIDYCVTTSEGTQYTWFSNRGISTSSCSNNIREQYTTSAQTSSCRWWERSPGCDYSAYFCFVYTGGGATVSGASYSRGVAPAFCV